MAASSSTGSANAVRKTSRPTAGSPCSASALTVPHSVVEERSPRASISISG